MSLAVIVAIFAASAINFEEEKKNKSYSLQCTHIRMSD